MIPPPNTPPFTRFVTVPYQWTKQKLQTAPRPVRLTLGAYLGIAAAHNVFCVYHNAKQELLDFRNNPKYIQIDADLNKIPIKDEWAAVKFGARRMYWTNVVHSFSWPMNVVVDVIPYVVLMLNPNPNPNPKEE
jgi:hypothetical protein